MNIRPACLDDISAVEAIEQSAPSPWSLSQIEEEIRRYGEIALVIRQRHDINIIGWCCCRLLPPEAELLKITISPQFRGSGCGSLLLAEVMKRCRENGCENLFLEVRKSNHQALNFYQKKGFHQLSLRKDYYSSPREDGLLLKNTLIHLSEHTTGRVEP